MNLAITTSSGKTLKAVKISSLVTIAGAALVLTTLAGVATFNTIESNAGESNSGQAAAASQSTFRASPMVIAPPPAMTVYLVGSEEQRQAVEDLAIMRVEDNAVYNPGRNWKFSVLLLTGVPAEDEPVLRRIEQVKADWQAAGASGLEVIDLRQPEPRPSAAVQESPIVIYLAGSQAKATEILAAVESDRNESETPPPVFHAFKVTTSEEEVRVSEFVESLQGRDVQIIDAR
jgi:hypothetical protein